MPRARAGRVSAVAWLASLALVLTGCVAQRDGAEVGRATASADVAIDADWSRVGDRGYVYFQANTDGKKHYELFRADLARGQVDQITDLPGPFGISNFSVSRAGLVVADASSLSDEAKWLRPDGSLVRLPGPRVLGPSVNEEGDVLASIITGRTESLAILRAGASRWRHIERGIRGWTVAWWSGADSVIQLTIGRRRTTWSRIEADGRRSPARPIAAGVYFPSAVTRHRQPVVMAARSGHTGLLWTPGQPPIRLPSGWENGCVSPDGTRLLLMSRGRFAVLDVADPDGPVHEIGAFSTPILGCGWVDEKFGP